MKSFLREIEDKFVELEEKIESPEKIKAAKEELEKYNLELQKTKEMIQAGYSNDINGDGISDHNGMPLDEEHDCEMCGEVHEGTCGYAPGGNIDVNNTDELTPAGPHLFKVKSICKMCGKAHKGECGSHHEEHSCEMDHPGLSHEVWEDKQTNEMSTSAATPGYNIPAAFSKRSNWKNKKLKYETVQEAMDRKYERLIESYTNFSNGNPKMTPKRKVERTIQEVSKKLKEIETLVSHTNKLKTESGMSRDNYGPRTEKALNKISQKLIKIAERVRALGE